MVFRTRESDFGRAARVFYILFLFHWYRWRRPLVPRIRTNSGTAPAPTPAPRQPDAEPDTSTARNRFSGLGKAILGVPRGSSIFYFFSQLPVEAPSCTKNTSGWSERHIILTAWLVTKLIKRANNEGHSSSISFSQVPVEAPSCTKNTSGWSERHIILTAWMVAKLINRPIMGKLPENVWSPKV